jgi:3-methyladenine DNA glycosylase AlkD
MAPKVAGAPGKRAKAATRVGTKERAPKPATGSLQSDVEHALVWLERHGSRAVRDNMAPRYGIHAKQAYGVTVANIRLLAKQLGRNHDLAQALWETGWYEARMLAAFVGQPERVTPAQMDRWCRDFDNWAICDTLCFHLFDRTPHAFDRVAKWAASNEVFVRRAAFALLASVALHDKKAADAPFVRCLPLIERGAADDRNFVKKSVSWALKSVGRRSATLHAAALKLAQKLAASPDPAPRWAGKDALRDLAKPELARRLKAKS